MNFKIKKAISSNFIINKLYSGIATIFTLHRVHPFEKWKLAPNENMKITPEFLENFVVKLKTEGYKFISLDSLYDILIHKERVEKQIVLTFDDGYKDNFVYAFPVLKKHAIPFTIYITTSFINRTTILWWYALEDLILLKDEISLSTGHTFSCKTIPDKVFSFMKIREIILSLDQNNLLEELNKLFRFYDINWSAKCDSLALNWSEVIQLSMNELVTIGGHTNNHFALNKISDMDVLRELNESHSLIESFINKPVLHFSYPYGTTDTVGKKEFDIIKKVKLKTATTTRAGNIYYKHIDFLHSLPRIMLTENFNIENIGLIRKSRIVTN